MQTQFLLLAISARSLFCGVWLCMCFCVCMLTCVCVWHYKAHACILVRSECATKEAKPESQIFQGNENETKKRKWILTKFFNAPVLSLPTLDGSFVWICTDVCVYVCICVCMYVVCMYALCELSEKMLGQKDKFCDELSRFNKFSVKLLMIKEWKKEWQRIIERERDKMIKP